MQDVEELRDTHEERYPVPMECIDDARRKNGVILIGATNFYDGLDRALIRDGRFDLHIRLDLPPAKPPRLL